MIIGTAGHIDHGKTTLIRALTGKDTDRLPEEKRRGISIELGYAFLDTPAGNRIGFIDVPGHERLVHTMISGATGMDAAMLLVAADDGVMPQTREHLAVLSLLGVNQCIAVITKTDLVDEARLTQVKAEVAALLAATCFAHSQVVVVSAQSKQGIAELLQALDSLTTANSAHKSTDKGFRLAVDRVMTLEGIGTVVTGTVHSGEVKLEDHLLIMPGEKRVRVRSLHAQDQAVSSAHAGQRCAMALAGVAKDDIARGNWLVSPETALQTQRIDVRLVCWHEEAKALQSGMHVHLHLGTSNVQGSLAVLQPTSIAPGSAGLAQIVLQKPISAWHGDPVLLRDASASRTIAGGTVLDPFAPVRYRRTAQRLAELAALQEENLDARLNALLKCSPQGVDAAQFFAAQCVPLSRRDQIIVNDAIKTDAYWWHQNHAQALQQNTLAELAKFHEQHPDELGLDAARLRRLVAPKLPTGLWHAMLADMHSKQQLAARGAFHFLPAHLAKLSSKDELIAQKIALAIQRAGYEGAWVRNLAHEVSEAEPIMRTSLLRLAQMGLMHQVVKDLYYDTATMRKLAAIARKLANENDSVVTAAMFRDATALGRKRAIQILEYFDKQGLLRRVGDLHKLRAESELFVD